MYKNVITLLILALAFLIPANSLRAQEAPDDNKGTISVTGSAVEYAAPDTAILVLAIETTAKTAKEASVQNARKADSVVNALKGQINQSAGDTVKTSSYSIQPVYVYDQPKKREVLSGYRAYNQLTVTTKQIKNIGEIIDAAVESGANQVQSISFSLGNTEEYCKKSLKKATENARAQADVVAQSLGKQIIGVKNAVTSCGVPEFRRPVMMMAKADFAGEAAPTPIEAGNIGITSNVSVIYYINK